MMSNICNNLPVVSVIMPCYNIEKYIVKAIESILSQGLKDFEILVVNDGSVDKTDNLIKSIKDVRIRCFQLGSNFGNYFARNFGLRHAKGEFIAFADADDISLPDRLSVQYEYLKNNSDVYCIGSQYELINSDGRSIGFMKRPLDYEEVKVMLFVDNYVAQPTIMFRSSLVWENGIRYDESFRYSGDYDFVAKVSRDFCIQNIPQTLVQYRKHPDQISSAKRDMQTDMANRVRRKQLEYLDVEFNEAEFHIHLNLILGKYLNDDELDQVEGWLNRLIEANYRLKCFNEDYFYLLCEQLAVSAIRNNQLGGWSIEKNLLLYIEKFFVPGSSILEFGSGKGTDALLKNYKVISIEHDHKYCVPRSPEHRCKLAPIHDGWYSRNDVQSILFGQKFDLILIDGPPGTLRQGILDHVDLFKGIQSVFVFDDMDRKLDHETMIAFCRELGLKHQIIQGYRKSFAICNPV